MVTNNWVCDKCGKVSATLQKLRGYQNRKFQCKPVVKLQDLTPEIVTSQPQLEQLQDFTPVRDYRGRWYDIQFVKRDHDPARLHKSLKHKTVWQADLNPNARDIPYFPNSIEACKQVYHRKDMHVLLLKNDIDGHLMKTVVEIKDKIVKFMKERSGWRIVSIDVLTIEITKDFIDPDTGLFSEKCLKELWMLTSHIKMNIHKNLSESFGQKNSSHT
ncbi:hypothetical protein RhiirA4_484557 [Rhizophagus irregularis]|uniref:Uncharacterized protein n=1 Tax=Rhizophagus irregularis TaxID=588596 RepID=A0A2I1HP27_9GLOM|nr:hypothetical protein RhiirA4_484557 [Rhizophagus irregularis]